MSTFAIHRAVEGDGHQHRVDVAFTDARTDLQRREDDLPRFAEHFQRVEAETGVPVMRVSQVHGADVLEVGAAGVPRADEHVPAADALVADRPGVGLMIRVADCLPVMFAAPAAGVIGAAHAGRRGTELGVARATVLRMRELGAGEASGDIQAWIGPHVCGGCYEVPQEMQDEVCAVLPEARAETTWRTPSLDLAAGVRAQLEALGVTVHDVGPCTLEDHAFHSYRRDGARAGRFAGLVWMP